jgi:hypothetical protein
MITAYDEDYHSAFVVTSSCMNMQRKIPPTAKKVGLANIQQITHLVSQHS